MESSGKGSSVASAMASLASLSSLTSVSSALSSSVPGLAPHTENARLQVSALWTSAKPWGEFFNSKKFTPPANPAELQERLLDNLQHFSANYVLCFLIVSAASVLVHPLSFVCVVLLALLYVFLFLQNAGPVAVGPVTLSPIAKKVAFAVIAVILLYLTNAVAILGSWALFGIILSLAHAAARVSVKEPDFDSPVADSSV